MSRAPLLEADGLRRTYGENVAVADFSLTVDDGEVVVLVGPNGCGKTTSVEMALGFRAADAGSCRVLGLEPSRDRRQLARLVGVQLQGAGLHPRVRVREHLQYIGAAYGTTAEVFELAEAMGLGGTLRTYYGSLSGGLQRRLLVVTALGGCPRLALLDEPTSGVDPESRRQFWSVVRSLVLSRGTGVLVTTHDLVEAERHADRVAVMRSGRLLAVDTPAGLLGMAHFARVVTCREMPAGDAAALAAEHAGAIIASEPDETCVAFTSVELAARFATHARERTQAVSITDREATLEDAYFWMASRDDEESR